eukprot:scaffold41553_cov175-Skeletonema_marinoi.AAC.1
MASLSSVVVDTYCFKTDPATIPSIIVMAAVQTSGVVSNSNVSRKADGGLFETASLAQKMTIDHRTMMRAVILILYPISCLLSSRPSRQ